MLFNGSNLTAGANDIEWSDRKWSLINHFIPYTEAEVNANERFESDFMQQYLRDKILSQNAINVLDAGRTLWKSYFSVIDSHDIRDQLKLNRSDVGWYQIRKALQHRNTSGNYPPVDFSVFESAYELLTEKLRPLVYELGFLRV